MKDTVSSMLDSLGKDPAEVAESLADKGVRGRRGSPTDCVVARYLRQCTADDASIGSVIVRVKWVRVHGTSRWGLGTRVKVPPAVSGFITGFDRGRYPDLLGGSRHSVASSPRPTTVPRETPEVLGPLPDESGREVAGSAARELAGAGAPV